MKCKIAVVIASVALALTSAVITPADAANDGDKRRDSGWGCGGPC